MRYSVEQHLLGMNYRTTSTEPPFSSSCATSETMGQLQIHLQYISISAIQSSGGPVIQQSSNPETQWSRSQDHLCESTAAADTQKRPQRGRKSNLADQAIVHLKKQLVS